MEGRKDSPADPWQSPCFICRMEFQVCRAGWGPEPLEHRIGAPVLTCVQGLLLDAQSWLG